MNHECTMDQELGDTAAQVLGRCYMSTHQVAALFCMKWHHGRQPGSVTSIPQSMHI